MFNQILKDIENTYKDFGEHDMTYDECEDICRNFWEEEYSYFCLDRSKKRYQWRYCICSESKNTYIECIPETKPFWLT